MTAKEKSKLRRLNQNNQILKKKNNLLNNQLKCTNQENQPLNQEYETATSHTLSTTKQRIFLFVITLLFISILEIKITPIIISKVTNILDNKLKKSIAFSNSQNKQDFLLYLNKKNISEYYIDDITYDYSSEQLKTIIGHNTNYSSSQIHIPQYSFCNYFKNTFAALLVIDYVTITGLVLKKFSLKKNICLNILIIPTIVIIIYVILIFFTILLYSINWDIAQTLISIIKYLCITYCIIQLMY